ncbi:MAG: hypothetical protein ACR2OO_12095, partial [Thermomicrobiales bacterium]
GGDAVRQDSSDDRRWASCDVYRRGPITHDLRRSRPGYPWLPTVTGEPGFAYRIGDRGPRLCWRCFGVLAKRNDGTTPLRFEEVPIGSAERCSRCVRPFSDGSARRDLGQDQDGS